MITKLIRCCGCNGKVDARLTTGEEIYPHRKDLYSLSFWKCDTCSNFVGCHKHSKDHQPLGCIPTPEIKKLRQAIHKLIDPLWQDGRYKRKELYDILSTRLGYRYHTATTRSVEECNKVISIVKELVA